MNERYISDGLTPSGETVKLGSVSTCRKYAHADHARSEPGTSLRIRGMMSCSVINRTEGNYDFCVSVVSAMTRLSPSDLSLSYQLVARRVSDGTYELSVAVEYCLMNQGLLVSLLTTVRRCRQISFRK